MGEAHHGRVVVQERGVFAGFAGGGVLKSKVGKWALFGRWIQLFVFSCDNAGIERRVGVGGRERLSKLSRLVPVSTASILFLLPLWGRVQQCQVTKSLRLALMPCIRGASNSMSGGNGNDLLSL